MDWEEGEKINIYFNLLNIYFYLFSSLFRIVDRLGVWKADKTDIIQFIYYFYTLKSVLNEAPIMGALFRIFVSRFIILIFKKSYYLIINKKYKMLN